MRARLEVIHVVDTRPHMERRCPPRYARSESCMAMNVIGSIILQWMKAGSRMSD